MIKKILFALALGIGIVMVMLQEDPWFRARVAHHYARGFGDALDCVMECKVKKLNLFLPTLELEDVRVYPRGERTWEWQCKRYTTRLS